MSAMSENYSNLNDIKLQQFKLAYNELVAKVKEPILKNIEYSVCSKCHNKSAIVEQIQIRAIDEEATSVVSCDYCKATYKK